MNQQNCPQNVTQLSPINTVCPCAAVVAFAAAFTAVAHCARLSARHRPLAHSSARLGNCAALTHTTGNASAASCACITSPQLRVVPSSCSQPLPHRASTSSLLRAAAAPGTPAAATVVAHTQKHTHSLDKRSHSLHVPFQCLSLCPRPHGALPHAALLPTHVRTRRQPRGSPSARQIELPSSAVAPARRSPPPAPRVPGGRRQAERHLCLIRIS
jgi:hypothetical protein